MNYPFLFQVPAALIAIVLFGLIILTNWLGIRLGSIQAKKSPEEVQSGLGAIEGSLIGLTALMLSFTFGMAATKFESRRQVIVDEANNIGTVVLRCDLYPDSVRTLLRADLQKYVEARINYYNAGADEEKIKLALNETNDIANLIWARVAGLSHNLDNRVMSDQMIPALNAMIDIVTTRDASRLAKVPPVILTVLLTLSLISSFLIGYGLKGKRASKILVLGFASMTTISLYLILDLDRPRRGIINLDAAEKRIVDLRTMFVEQNK